MKSIFDLFKRTFRCQKLSQTLECVFNVSNNASNKGGKQDVYGEGIKFDGGGGNDFKWHWFGHFLTDGGSSPFPL